MVPLSNVRIGNLFTGSDRCDSCNARASMLALLHAGGRLLFCGHHARALRPSLELIAECIDNPFVPHYCPMPAAYVPAAHNN
jgi:hypothetical protein